MCSSMGKRAGLFSSPPPDTRFHGYDGSYAKVSLRGNDGPEFKGDFAKTLETAKDDEEALLSHEYI